MDRFHVNLGGIYLAEEKTLARGLKNRHVQLIAIGGAIGTGLFLGSGHSIHLAGPSILLTYMITGVVCFFMMRALGELLISNTEYHSFVDFIHDYMGEKAAFFTGWTYWFCWISVAMADITAVGVYVKYWFPDIASWIPSLIMMSILVLMNLLSVKIFGELEFWFAFIKVIAIIALIVVGVYFILMGFDTPIGVASFSNLWTHGGWFPNGFEGFIQSFQMAVFAFAAIELVGLTAGETEDPERVIPKAINSIPIRIILFYCGALGVVMSVFPWNAVVPSQSPFVQVFTVVGITAAATIVNFVVLTSAASACNSGVFSTSRLLYTLARRGEAPGMLEILTSKNVPANALFLSVLVIMVAVAMQYIMPEGVFVIVTSVATFCFIFIWSMITICHLRYRKARPDLAAKNTFKMPLYPFLNYVVLGFFAFVLVSLAFNDESRLALFVTPVWFILLQLIYSLHKEVQSKKEVALRTTNIVESLKEKDLKINSLETIVLKQQQEIENQQRQIAQILSQLDCTPGRK